MGGIAGEAGRLLISAGLVGVGEATYAPKEEAPVRCQVGR